MERGREKYLLCVEVEDIESICGYICDEDRRAVDEDNGSEGEDEVRVEEGRAARFPEQLRIIIMIMIKKLIILGLFIDTHRHRNTYIHT